MPFLLIFRLVKNYLSYRKSDLDLELIQNIIKVCKFRVGSFNYPMNKIIFYNELIPEDTIIKSILDYRWGYFCC